MALLVSFISLGIAAVALGWNVYKDVIRKPRLRVSFGVYDAVSLRSFNIDTSFILVSGVNLGPDAIVVTKILLKYKNRTKPFGVVLHDPKWTQLPKRIEAAEEIQLVVPYDKDCFLSTGFYKVGLMDSFGRRHWVERKNILDAKQRYAIDFPANSVQKKPSTGSRDDSSA